MAGFGYNLWGFIALLALLCTVEAGKMQLTKQNRCISPLSISLSTSSLHQFPSFIFQHIYKSHLLMEKLIFDFFCI
jgi:hypothetical protein